MIFKSHPVIPLCSQVWEPGSRQYFSSFNIHKNYLGILLKVRFSLNRNKMWDSAFLKAPKWCCCSWSTAHWIIKVPENLGRMLRFPLGVESRGSESRCNGCWGLCPSLSVPASSNVPSCTVEARNLNTSFPIDLGLWIWVPFHQSETLRWYVNSELSGEGGRIRGPHLALWIVANILELGWGGSLPGQQSPWWPISSTWTWELFLNDQSSRFCVFKPSHKAVNF